MATVECITCSLPLFCHCVLMKIMSSRRHPSLFSGKRCRALANEYYVLYSHLSDVIHALIVNVIIDISIVKTYLAWRTKSFKIHHYIYFLWRENGKHCIFLNVSSISFYNVAYFSGKPKKLEFTPLVHQHQSPACNNFCSSTSPTQKPCGTTF